ncbi:MAG TPA: hypothetical protein VEP47_04320 [Reyranella sp.]|jgi:hypothetical protein|nr:hypothetical protein [Reyranella sp.]
MAAQITTYGGLKAGVLAWLARTGDALLDSRFDDFLLNCERRIYYGHATDDPANPLRSDALRIPEMETADAAFALNSGTVAQPATFLELISAQLNSPQGPLQIVSQRTLDGYGTQSLGGTRLIAVSGQNFRLLDAPTAGSATLRYYQKLTTPAGATVNAILTGYPDVYLYGCLVEAAIFTQDQDAALRYIPLYNASVSGLNARTQRITASSVPVIRLRAGMVV